MKICPNCHKEFNDDINFCKSCGTKLVDQLTCPNCGETISPNDLFCGKCGYELIKKEENVVATKVKKPFSSKKA